jgi:hypothetical protein
MEDNPQSKAASVVLAQFYPEWLNLIFAVA